MSLLTTFQVRRVAFEWDGTTRIYRASQIGIFSEADRDKWELSDGSRDHATQGEWLSYEVRADYFERVSPAADSGNDRIDLENALEDAATEVTFYPIYDVDNSVSYVVIPASGRRTMLATGSPARGLFRPSVIIQIENKNRLADLPTWLRMTRTY